MMSHTQRPHHQPLGHRPPTLVSERSVSRRVIGGHLALALVSLLGSGCEGSLKPVLPSPPELSVPQEVAPDPTSSPAVAPMLRPPTEEDQCIDRLGYVAPTVIRRLTRQEYENTARDLIGVDVASIITGFPPEEEVNGFDNQSKSLQVSALHVEQYLYASEQLAELIAQRFSSLSSCVPMNPEDPTEAEPCITHFIESFGQRAWRRPLSPQEIDRLLSLYRAGVSGAQEDLVHPDAHLLGPVDPFKDGVTLLAMGLLQSPHFLYRVEIGTKNIVARYGEGAQKKRDREAGEVRSLSGYELASRLSYLLWRSMPDDELFAAAEAGLLGDPAELSAQAERMLLDPRANEGLWSFFEQWLALDEIIDSDKDPSVFPTFTRDLNMLMKTEARLFVEDVVFEQRDLRRLFDSPYSFQNAALAAHYTAGGEGATLPASKQHESPEWAFNVADQLSPVEREAAIAELPAGDSFVRVALNPERRSGILTRGGVLSLTTKPNMGDPVHRGIYVRERLLCTPLPPPPPDIVVVAPDPDPSLTTREQFSIHSSEPACAGCHRLVDPIGFGLERFDPVGRFRESENYQEIDDSGEIVSTLDIDGTFTGSAELAQKLAGSEQVQRCVVLNISRFAHGRSETSGELCDIDDLYQRYAESGYDMFTLLNAIISSSNFRRLHFDAQSAEPAALSGGVP